MLECKRSLFYLQNEIKKTATGQKKTLFYLQNEIEKKQPQTKKTKKMKETYMQVQRYQYQTNDF